MEKNSVFTVLITIYSTILLLFIAGCSQEQQKKDLGQTELVERGKILITAGGCTDCHSPKIFGPQGPEPDPKRLLSGYPAENPLPEVDLNLIQPSKWVLFTQDVTGAVGPWGASFAANLTPDNETGIGTRQPEMFINAMRSGKHLGAGRPVLPPMPWQGIGQLSDEDLKAMFAYLKTLKPVNNKVPQPLSIDQLAVSKQFKKSLLKMWQGYNFASFPNISNLLFAITSILTYR